jgi:hypothetical protein
VIAVDWSGAKSGAERKIWLAEVAASRLRCLENGRTRAEIASHLADQAGRDADLLVGLDFAFSMPAWYLRSLGLTSAPQLWELAAVAGESWLERCPPPFWGRKGTRRQGTQAVLRETDARLSAVGRRPKPVFQIRGAGSVGTGSIRGMPVLSLLRRAGFAIWPFDAPRLPLVVEIYPRLLTGPVVKSNPQARRAHLAQYYPDLDPTHRELAAASDDAFDAAVSALEMDRCRGELAHLPVIDQPELLLEGLIWVPGPQAGIAGRPC